MPTTKAQGKIENGRRNEQQRFGRLQRKHGHPKNGIDGQDAKIDVADVFGVDFSQSRAGGPKDIDPPPDDTVGGCCHTGR